MATMVISAWLLLLLAASTSPALGGKYYSNGQTVANPATMKKTHLHFYWRDTISGTNPTSIPVAAPKGVVVGDGNPVPFGALYASDGPFTEGPEPDSKVIGNARGFYISISRGSDITLLMNGDYEFTSGRFNGSSIAVFSRDPITPVKEVGVVGGRGQFRMATGFIVITTLSLNFTTGNALYEYNATIFH